MPAEHFDVVFRGHVLEGQDPAIVQQQIGQAFNIPEARLKHMFSGHLIVLKKAVDIETASRYQLAFRRLGALLEVRANKAAKTQTASAPKTPASPALTPQPPLSGGLQSQSPLSGGLKSPSPASSAPPASTDAAEVHWTVEPANTGTLEDCAITAPPTPVPSVQHLTMATPGARVDQTPPAPPRKIDTSDLDLIHGENWTLDDCQIPPQPVVVDLAGLDMLEEWNALDETEPLAMPHIDTSALDMVAATDWSLKDCQPPPPPALSINLDGLSLADIIQEDQN